MTGGGERPAAAAGRGGRVAPPGAVGDGFERTAVAVRALDEVTRRLRRECPWDREQDERSIVPHTVEEAYELADAVASGDDVKLLDELGDVLFQVDFLSLLLEERGAGSLAAVADACREKLVRRHPHVFGEAEARTAGEVRRNWEEIKRTSEGRGAGDPFEDVPEGLPALLYARKGLRRAERLGVQADAERARGRLEELLPALGRGGSGGRDEEREGALGEALFALVEIAAARGDDPELALRAATHRWQAEVGEGAPA